MIINNDKELLRENQEEKLGILDLELDINNKEKVDVEIQLINNRNLVERLLFYFSKLYQSSIKRGADYVTAKRVVLIAIIDYEFEITKDIDKIDTVWQLREENHPEIVLTSLIEIHIIELEKVRNMYGRDKNNEKIQWLLFIDDPNTREVEEIMESNKDIKEATVVVRQMSEEDKLRRLADLREKAIMDEKAIYATGIQVGKEQAIKEKNIEIARKLYQKGIEIEEIADILCLKKEELERIIKDKN